MVDRAGTARKRRVRAGYAGAGTPGQCVSVLGSTLVLKGVSHELVGDPAGAVYSHRHPDGWWLPGGASNVGARALITSYTGRDLAALDELAADHGPASAVIYPLVGSGERFPFVADHAQGFTLGHVDDDVAGYRATLEGVAFVERLGYERLAALGVPVTPPITATGGGSTSRVWNRIRASTLGMPVTAKPRAGTARGAAILAATGSAHPDLATAAAAMGVAGEEIEPDPAERDPLEAHYQLLLDALRDRGWLITAASGPRTPGRA